MTGWGSHGLDQVQWALGMDESGPIEVWTDGRKFQAPVYTKPQGRQPAEKNCEKPIVFYRYACGAVLRLDGGPRGGAIFIGEKGKVRIDRRRLSSEPAEITQEALKESNLRIHGGDHMQDWLDCIRSRQRPKADVEIGHRSSTVCHLGNIARWLGRRLRWDPEREIFPNDKEANELLARPQRKPYEFPAQV
jgi:hypothetical protein